ncbi:hypothetical protein D3C78_524090 [compost metagenome]
MQHQHGPAKAGDEGTEHHEHEEVVGQAGHVRAQHGTALKAPTQQRHGPGDSAQGGQAHAQGQCASAQAAFGQPANHGGSEQALKDQADQCPDQDRGHQASDEEPAVFSAQGTGDGIGRLAAQVTQAHHIVLGRTDQRLPESRAQRGGRPAGHLRVELATAQVDDLRGQVARRLSQLGGLILLGEHGLFLRLQLLALQGQGRGFILLYRADDLELVVELLHVSSAQGAQRIGLSLDLHGSHAQLREQVVVGVAGHALTNLVEPVAQLLDTCVFIQHRQLAGNQVGNRHGSRPGRRRKRQHQGHYTQVKSGKADTPHRTFLITRLFGGGFYAACGLQESAVSRSNSCRLRSTPQR